MAAEIKEKLKEHRKTIAETQSKANIEEELGPGVEIEPVEPEKVDLESFPTLDFADARSIKTIVEQIKNLPKLEDVNEQLKKIDTYEQYAKKVWIMKRAEDESFDIPVRIVEKVEKRQIGDAVQERLIWKRDKEGKIVSKPKTFHYASLPMQDRDELMFLESAMQDAHFAVIEEGVRINRMTNDPTTTEQMFQKYAQDKVWQSKKVRWEKSIQDYYSAVFKAYFGASDDDIRSIGFDDVINYSDIALYKGGVKSPK
ncbi:hypothetical protein [Glutamicibacter sp.]|jgi:hypothetical protein|uniref:hypothetical protein n=1 Tax=Glutamicibacter sp. TaxID=1931995 RepID=UPI002B4A7195|nr:hypothetical protein [Glutamicibacter sp.]HJX79136.1 hypothetical protein [Glutamicibacter sp.]